MDAPVRSLLSILKASFCAFPQTQTNLSSFQQRILRALASFTAYTFSSMGPMLCSERSILMKTTLFNWKVHSTTHGKFLIFHPSQKLLQFSIMFSNSLTMNN